MSSAGQSRVEATYLSEQDAGPFEDERVRVVVVEVVTHHTPHTILPHPPSITHNHTRQNFPELGKIAALRFLEWSSRSELD